MIRWVFAFLILCSPAWAQTAVKDSQVNPTPPIATACCTLTTGGVAQNFQNATSNSGQALQSPVQCVLVNPATATEQGIATAEEIWVSVFGAAVLSAGSTSIAIEAGDNIRFLPATNAISWNAATTGHKVSGYCWQ